MMSYDRCSAMDRSTPIDPCQSCRLMELGGSKVATSKQIWQSRHCKARSARCESKLSLCVQRVSKTLLWWQHPYTSLHTANLESEIPESSWWGFSIRVWQTFLLENRKMRRRCCICDIDGHGTSTLGEDCRRWRGWDFSINVFGDICKRRWGLLFDVWAVSGSVNINYLVTLKNWRAFIKYLSEEITKI